MTKPIGLGSGLVPSEKLAWKGRVAPVLQMGIDTRNFYSGDILERFHLRKTLENLQVEIALCLKFLDFGSCHSCWCGLLGHGLMSVSLSITKGCAPKDLSVDKARVLRGKVPLGLTGSCFQTQE